MIQTPPGDDEPTAWPRRLVRWLAGFAAMGYGLSLLFHAALLVGLSLIMISGMQKRQYSLIASQSEGADVALDEILDTRIDLGPGAEAGSEQPEFQIVEPVPVETPEPVVTTDATQTVVSKLGEGIGDGESDADGAGSFQFAMPQGGKAVTKGSFTAWTVPEDPDPQIDFAYKIVIQIELPARTDRYRLSDLTGVVVGTDGYRQILPWDRRNPYSSLGARGEALVPLKSNDFLPVRDNKVQLIIEVPCGANLVRDRIDIKSKMLKEHQVLDIQFRSRPPGKGRGPASGG